MIVIPLQTQFFGPNGFMSSGAFAAVTNEFVSVDSFFLIGDDHMVTWRTNLPYTGGCF